MPNGNTSNQPASLPFAWRSENGWAAPKRIQLADDTMTADAAYRLACEGTAMLWRGDFQNARQLLQAIARRIERKPKKPRAPAASLTENDCTSACHVGKSACSILTPNRV